MSHIFLYLDGGIDISKKNYRVFFESYDVEFDGVPYIYVADKMYICHLGKDKTEVTRKKIRQQSMEKRLKVTVAFSTIKICSFNPISYGFTGRKLFAAFIIT